MAEPLLFVMPSLGADMEHGVLATWLIKPGDVVKRGQVIAVVETHKGAIEVEFFHDAVVSRLVAEEGDEVPVGGLLAELTAASGEVAPQAPIPAAASAPILTAAAVPAVTATPVAAPAPARAPAPAPRAAPPAPAPAPAPPETTPYRSSILSGRPPTPDPWVAASPSARMLAYERGVDLHDVHGTGRHATITRADVEAAAVRAAAPVPDPARTTPRPVDAAHAMRLAIAAAMSKSNREIPHYYLSHDIDMATPLARLAERNASRPSAERVLPGALLVWATAKALVKFPALNGFWVDDQLRPGAGIHPGVAVSLRGGGLMTPAMHDADKLTPEEVMAALQDLVLRTRAGHLRSSELMDPTITITSLGDTGVESVFGVIYPPQVALVGFGRIVDRPVAIDGMLAVHPVVTATLAGDHRASDGHVGARFLSALDKTLQEFS